MLTGILEAGIEVHEEVVLMTTKGEAIALGIAQMSTVELSSCDHGVVAKVKRCIMERDLYPRRWGLGPTALEKKKMKSDGKLDKYGRPNEATPSKWNAEYTDFNAPLENGVAKAPKQIEAAPVTEGDKMDTEVSEKAVKDESQPKATDEGESKKRKRHEGETPEEKAERKRKKKEKKEKRKSKETKAEVDEDSD